jgi:hypothetical protein
MPFKRSKHNLFIAFVGLTFIAFITFYLFPACGELCYGQIIYPLFRTSFDWIFRLFDQSLMLVLIGFLLFLVVDRIIKGSIPALLRYLIVLLSLFYWVWGFNYFRIPLQDKMGLSFQAVSEEERLEMTMQVLEKCISLSEEINEWNKADQAEKLLKLGIEMSDSLPFLDASYIKAVPVYPSTLFLRLGISGMYFPFTGQAQYEPALGPIDLPYTIAHEWCHAAGIGPEDEANFIAYLICLSSDDATIQYSAYMNLLNELLFYYKISDPPLFEEMMGSFTPIMKEQVMERKALFIKYSGPISEMSDEMIDNYLKINQQGGIQDYHRLSEYVFAWEKR